MATVYDVKIKLCSPFCSYSEKAVEDILRGLIEGYANPETGLTFDPPIIYATRKA